MYSTFLYSVVYLIIVRSVLVPVIHSVGLSYFLKDNTASIHPSVGQAWIDKIVLIVKYFSELA